MSKKTLRTDPDYRAKENAQRRARYEKRKLTDPEKHEANKARMRMNMIRRKYGLSRDEYEKMFEVQEGLCAICHNPEIRVREGQILPLCVDHDEKSGQVRGLLCSNCNVGIGYFDHDIKRLKEAITYLQKERNS